jgi:hypothetical protein
VVDKNGRTNLVNRLSGSIPDDLCVSIGRQSSISKAFCISSRSLTVSSTLF